MSGMGDSISRSIELIFQASIYDLVDHDEYYYPLVPPENPDRKVALFALEKPILSKGEWLECEDLGVYSYNEWRSAEIHFPYVKPKRIRAPLVASWSLFRTPVFIASERNNDIYEGGSLGRFSVAVPRLDAKPRPVFVLDQNRFDDSAINRVADIIINKKTIMHLKSLIIQNLIVNTCKDFIIYNMDINR